MEPTYYDFVKRLRPYVVEHAEADAARLLERPTPPVTIAGADDFDSSIAQVFAASDEETIKNVAKITGFSVEHARKEFPAIKQVMKEQLLATYQAVNHEYHSILNFALHGKKVFSFSENLTEHLVHTELNVKAEFIKPPFPACLFHFRSVALVNALYNLRGDIGRRQINRSDIDYDAPISVFLTMLDADPLPGQKLVIVAAHAKQPDKCYMMTKRELYLGEGWSLEQSLRTKWEELTPDNLGSGISIDRKADLSHELGSETFYTDGLVFFRAILNAILYVGSDHAELTPQRSKRNELEAAAAEMVSAPRRKKKLQEAVRYGSLDNVDVGSSIGPIIIQRGAEGAGRGHLGAGAAPNQAIMVRGHWRTQWFGEGSLESKIIWIKPYRKGPEMADLVSKPYLVK
ncbi:hypothetical protein ACYPKM_04725 [Pseudomonas aeruginosa]